MMQCIRYSPACFSALPARPAALKMLVGHTVYSSSVDKYDDAVNVTFFLKGCTSKKDFSVVYYFSVYYRCL